MLSPLAVVLYILFLLLLLFRRFCASWFNRRSRNSTCHCNHHCRSRCCSYTKTSSYPLIQVLCNAAFYFTFCSIKLNKHTDVNNFFWFVLCMLCRSNATYKTCALFYMLYNHTKRFAKLFSL